MHLNNFSFFVVIFLRFSLHRRSGFIYTRKIKLYRVNLPCYVSMEKVETYSYECYIFQIVQWIINAVLYILIFCFILCPYFILFPLFSSSQKPLEIYIFFFLFVSFWLQTYANSSGVTLIHGILFLFWH